ncbi:MAG: tRNA glutamyl-Q(34) synthetase GluQRS [Gammaproteobacteria bacterium]
MDYVGRFAPSPTGPLHAGSIATAVASYLHARQRGGRWLLRIDDLDPPRCVPGSAQSIVELLERLHLHWDGRIHFQAQRRERHADVAAGLIERRLAFRCDCSRSELAGAGKAGPLGIHYAGRCRDRELPDQDTAIRMRVEPGEICFEDRLQGLQCNDLHRSIGDYVIYRRDQLPAYHLAAVVDDAEQGVTDVVRGCDLLPVTSIHVHLARALGLPRIRYWHVPVLCDVRGAKLSKRDRAASVEDLPAAEIAVAALRHLGAEPPGALAGASLESLWQWAAEHWQIEALAGITRRVLDAS